MIETDSLSLIRTCVRSVWTLEILLTLARERGREWTEGEMVSELRASLPIVRESLAALSGAGLVAVSPSGRTVFQPNSSALEDAAANLARAFEMTPVAVIKAIASAPHDRVQVFADAFRFKKPEQP